MGIKEKLEDLAILDKLKELAIFEKLKDKKKLVIIVASVILVLIIGVVALAWLGQEEENKQQIIFSQTPEVSEEAQNTNKTETNSANAALADDASEEEIEAEIQRIMSEVEMLTVKQEQVSSKIETIKESLDKSDEVIADKRREINNLTKQAK